MKESKNRTRFYQNKYIWGIGLIFGLLAVVYLGWRYSRRAVISLANYPREILEVSGDKCKIVYAPIEVEMTELSTGALIHVVWIGNLNQLYINEIGLTPVESSLVRYTDEFQVLVSEADFSLVDIGSQELIFEEGEYDIYCAAKRGSFLSNGRVIRFVP